MEATAAAGMAKSTALSWDSRNRAIENLRFRGGDSEAKISFPHATVTSSREGGGSEGILAVLSAVLSVSLGWMLPAESEAVDC